MTRNWWLLWLVQEAERVPSSRMPTPEHLTAALAVDDEKVQCLAARGLGQCGRAEQATAPLRRARAHQPLDGAEGLAEPLDHPCDGLVIRNGPAIL